MPGPSAQRAQRDQQSEPRPLVHTSARYTRTAPRQARSARSLDLILDAAERLLHVRGVVETSTVDVAADAGVSVGRLYYWFPDKDAVVQAVLNRAASRLSALWVDMIIDDDSLSLTDQISGVVPAIGQFFRQHQGSLAVLQRGPVDGSDPGGPLRVLFVDLMAKTIELRVAGLAPRERDQAADTVVRIVIAMLVPYVRADHAHANLYLDEAGSVVSAYLQRRYPGAHDPLWTIADGPIRTSRRPRTAAKESRRVHAVLASPE